VALHIATGRAHPTYIYGQHYMGALEAYLAAPFVGVFGPSITTLRLGTLALFIGFFWATYWWSRRTFSPWFAVLVTVFLALGSDRVLRNELQANGGYGEMLFLGALLVALTAALALPRVVVRRRWLAFGAWGVTAGAAMWSDALVAPYVLVLGLALLALCWRELLGWPAAALVGGSIIGLAPAIIHNVRLPAGVGTLHDLRAYDVVDQPGTGITLMDHVRGTVEGTALSTGMCDMLGCTPWQRWWAWAVPALLLAAIALGGWTLLHRRRPAPSLPTATRPEPVRAVLLVALAAGALLTMGVFGRSTHSVILVWQSSRYVSNVMISAPVLLWPLWVAVRTRARGGWPRLATAVVNVSAVGVLALVAVTAASAHVSVFAESRDSGVLVRDRDRDVVAALDRLGVDRFYTDFFLCHRLIFQTDERLVCATMLDDLTPGWDRYLPYRDTLAQTPDPAYILYEGSEMERQFQAYLGEHGLTATVTPVDAYRIYQLPSRIPVPN
jgi:hypothetical protein